MVLNHELGLIQELSQQPEGYQVKPIADFEKTTSGTAKLYVDPARGTLLNIFTQKASFQDRIEAGGTIGYIIIALLALGLLISLERLVTLTLIGARVKSQAKNVATQVTTLWAVY